MSFLIITIITILNVQAQYEYDESKAGDAAIAPNMDLDVFLAHIMTIKFTVDEI